MSLGFHIDLLRGPWTCFNASLYAALLIVDPEEEVFPEELVKIENDIREKGLSVMLITDWYDDQALVDAEFLDEDTRSKWFPVTGGSNVPVYNRLLNLFGGALGTRTFEGSFTVANDKKVRNRSLPPPIAFLSIKCDLNCSACSCGPVCRRLSISL